MIYIANTRFHTLRRARKENHFLEKRKRAMQARRPHKGLLEKSTEDEEVLNELHFFNCLWFMALGSWRMAHENDLAMAWPGNGQCGGSGNPRDPRNNGPGSVMSHDE